MMSKCCLFSAAGWLPSSTLRMRYRSPRRTAEMPAPAQRPPSLLVTLDMANPCFALNIGNRGAAQPTSEPALSSWNGNWGAKMNGSPRRRLARPRCSLSWSRWVWVRFGGGGSMDRCYDYALCGFEWGAAEATKHLTAEGPPSGTAANSKSLVS